MKTLVFALVAVATTVAGAPTLERTFAWPQPLSGDHVVATRIYEVSGQTSLVAEAPQPATAATVSGIVPGVHSYCAKFVDAQGHESPPSPQLDAVIQEGFTVQVTR